MENNTLAWGGQFNPNATQGAFFDDIGTGIGEWVEGWGANNKATAEYNQAVVDQKRAAIVQQGQVVSAAIKIAGLFALVICAVLIIKALKKQ